MKRCVLLVCLIAAGFGFEGTQRSSRVMAADPPAGTILVDKVGIGFRHSFTWRDMRLVATPSFVLPTGPWGVTYAYRCGAGEDFWMAVDEFESFSPRSMVYARKSRGNGFKMETNRVVNVTVDPLADSPGVTEPSHEVIVSSRCRWHVRVVVGPRSVVSRSVPSIP